jgi:hypothetical protein
MNLFIDHLTLNLPLILNKYIELSHKEIITIHSLSIYLLEKLLSLVTITKIF